MRREEIKCYIYSHCLWQEVVQKFGGALEASAEGQYNGWTTPYDKLASIIIADQLVRHAF